MESVCLMFAIPAELMGQALQPADASSCFFLPEGTDLTGRAVQVYLPSFIHFH